MKSIFTLFVTVLLISCSSEKDDSLNKRFENYMKDSVVALSFNDPGSYEFVSIDIDSVTNHEYARKNMKEDSTKLADLNQKIILDSLDGYTDIRSNYTGSLHIYQSNIDRYRKDLSEADYVYKVNALISYRANNKLGAKILDQTMLSYFPPTNKIKREN
jgi:hypothetical protein